MDVRVEAGPLVAGATVVESKVFVVESVDVVIISPVLSRFALTSVISVGGNSISSITPESNRIGVLATV